MSKRKYTEFDIGRRVNVSSSGHYSFSIHIKGYSYKWLKWDGHGDFWSSTAIPSFPAYVVRALERLLLERLKADDTIYYENDQWGGERTTNLRYHDPERIQRWIVRLEQEQGGLMSNKHMGMKWYCMCGHELKNKGFRKSAQWIGIEVSAWCDHCTQMAVVYVDETDTQKNVRLLREGEPMYYGDDAEV